MKHKLLSRETILSMHTHTHTCTHIGTGTHRHTHTQALAHRSTITDYNLRQRKIAAWSRTYSKSVVWEKEMSSG